MKLKSGPYKTWASPWGLISLPVLERAERNLQQMTLWAPLPLLPVIIKFIAYSHLYLSWVGEKLPGFNVLQL